MRGGGHGAAHRPRAGRRHAGAHHIMRMKMLSCAPAHGPLTRAPLLQAVIIPKNTFVVEKGQVRTLLEYTPSHAHLAAVGWALRGVLRAVLWFPDRRRFIYGLPIP